MPLGNKSDICLQTYFLIGKFVYHFLKETLFIKLKLNFVLRYICFCGENICFGGE